MFAGLCYAGLGTYMYINHTNCIYDDTDIDGSTMAELGFSRADFLALAGVEVINYATETAQYVGCRKTGCTYTYANITLV